MALVVLGINHRTAPLEVREQVVFEPSRIPDALRELASLPAIRESAILSTCNRTEIYCVADSGVGGLGKWLENYHQLGTSIHDCLYRHDGTRAVSHAFSVAAGLDSMVSNRLRQGAVRRVSLATNTHANQEEAGKRADQAHKDVKQYDWKKRVEQLINFIK